MYELWKILCFIIKLTCMSEEFFHVIRNFSEIRKCWHAIRIKSTGGAKGRPGPRENAWMGSQSDLAQRWEGNTAPKFWRRSEPGAVCCSFFSFFLYFIDSPPSVQHADLSQTFAVRNYARRRQIRGVTRRGNPRTKDGGLSGVQQLTWEKRNTGGETGFRSRKWFFSSLFLLEM